MELKWLVDYLALVEQGSFSRAAASRFITQPAFSRRIRSLEAWIGVSLVDRNQYPLTLTSAGEAFIPRARQLADAIYLHRDQLRSMVNPQKQLTICSQHALAVSFFPDWVETVESHLDDSLIRLDTVDLHDAVESFLSGGSDFLLCYASAERFHQLQHDDVESLCVGRDELIAVSAVSKAHTSGEHRSLHDCSSGGELKLLSHPPQSFFGQLISRELLPQLPKEIELVHRYQSALSEGLKALALRGQGVAYLPRSIVQQELDNGSLVELTGAFKSLSLEIHLCRLKHQESTSANRLWQYLLEQQPSTEPHNKK